MKNSYYLASFSENSLNININDSFIKNSYDFLLQKTGISFQFCWDFHSD